jgi:hypothetical protein
MIDYIYLILIFCLIGFIVFIIYLSYEYRIREGFALSNINSSSLNSTALSSSINNNANSFLNNYNNFIIDTNNKQTLKNNLINLELLDSSKGNLVSSQYIANLANGIKPTTSSAYPIGKLISTIKSKYNSQYLSTLAKDNSKYGILVNDKCLTVNGLCKDEFCLLDCQKTLFSSDSQKFSTKRIFNSLDAAKVMNVPVNQISTTNIYPYNIFTSTVNNNCLTIGNEGITIEKCNLNNIKQKWDISPDENICVLK